MPRVSPNRIVHNERRVGRAPDSPLSGGTVEIYAPTQPGDPPVQLAFLPWQAGPMTGPFGRRNGVTVEDLLVACADRLESFQGTATRCPENQAAIESIEAALYHLRSRKDRRVREGSIGTFGERKP